MMICTCDDFKENAPKVDSLITLASLRYATRDGYTGKIFVYCPWCGKHLIEKKDE